ncbi:chitin synthase I, partial [Halocaridina rubra]
RLSVQETKDWDVFRALPPARGARSQSEDDFLTFLVKLLKIFAYLFTFAVVLVSGVITKGLVLLMTSQLKTNKTVPVCSKRYGILLNEKEYVAQIPIEENVVWAWVLLFSFAVPELGTWFRSTRMCVFKSWKRPSFEDFFIVWIFETLHCIGTAVLVYIVLPELDVVKGAMITNCVAFIPGLFSLLSRTKTDFRVGLKVMLDSLALACQLTGFFLWPIIHFGTESQDWRVWVIPPALLLVSFGWWENFVSDRSNVSFISYLGKIKERMWKTRYFSYMFISLWKILVFFGFMVICMSERFGNWSTIFDLKEAFNPHYIIYSEIQETLISDVPDAGIVAPMARYIPIKSEEMTPIYVFLVQALTAWLCYVFGKFACKIYIQGFSFAFPVNLTIPLTVSLLVTACGLKFEKVCAFDFMPAYLFWECKNGDILSNFISKDHAWVWIFWLLSQTWITLHIWYPKCERLASTEKLFVSPMYNSLLIDQSLALNRRKHDEGELKADDLDFNRNEANKDMSQYYETTSIHSEASNLQISKAKSSDFITRIYAVATMWHETEDEIMLMLKSILRMDEDQCARRVAQKYLKVIDPDYYEFETHIFFDDAFEVATENEDENVSNSFVKLFVSLVDKAASHVHGIDITVRPPKKFPTPYGGRLVWTLPGKTKIIVHLKDKSKIRHKKRWSQVMYMYYLLGFKLMDQPISIDRKDVIAENTYLLALDGDIDFAPTAVALLVDLMRKNHNLGAACGRIHPVGGGLMVWYQMFEYAVGHWLQKATEHVIGCVLCSPGCFSLFRGKALMDDNVMKTYTTISSQARHYVQYDQGEDRWLCTLLLQRGYRVEYSAASDAYTHAPEGFGEFYNQRRRWVPSTMANIMDLLQEYKRTVQINDNISMPYILYQ